LLNRDGNVGGKYSTPTPTPPQFKWEKKDFKKGT